ncbi:hypothetical protein H0H93_013338 [Arthromyces matolae]|nr:hypothetical protein H0H93_013338 [Arthromyces matolae]
MGYGLWTPFSDTMFDASPQLVRYPHPSKLPPRFQELSTLWQSLGHDLSPQSFDHSIAILAHRDTTLELKALGPSLPPHCALSMNNNSQNWLEKLAEDATIGYALWTPFSRNMFGESPQLLRHIHTHKVAASSDEMDAFWEAIGPHLASRSLEHAITIMVDRSTLDLSTLSSNPLDATFVEFYPEYHGLNLEHATPSELIHLPILLDGAKRLDLYTQYHHADLFGRLQAADLLYAFSPRDLHSFYQERLYHVIDEAQQHGWLARFVDRGWLYANLTRIINASTMGYGLWTPFSDTMFGSSPQLLRYPHPLKLRPHILELSILWQSLGPNLLAHSMDHSITILAHKDTIDGRTLTYDPEDLTFVAFRTEYKHLCMPLSSSSHGKYLPVLLDGQRRIELFKRYLHPEIRFGLGGAYSSSPPLLAEIVSEAKQLGWVARFIDRALQRLALCGLQVALKDFNATWRSMEQQLAVLAVLKMEGDVCAILPTGAGKTMLAIIPALIQPQSLSIIVLPLRSLLLDYKRKLTTMGISFELFDIFNPHLVGNHNLILVSVDHARTEPFFRSIHALHSRRPIGRLFFDECHYPLVNDRFRSVLDDIYQLRTLPFQLIILSATIPPPYRPTVAKLFHLVSCSIISMPSHHPNLQYIIHPPENQTVNLVKNVTSFVKGQLLLLGEHERCLVFVSIKLSEGVPLAEALGCDFYHAGPTLSNSKRECFYHRWRQGENKVMVCTNAFSAGNDYPHVRLVVHAGHPRDMVSYLQETGRAGRDNSPSQCVLFPHSAPMPLPSPLPDYSGALPFWNMIFTSTQISQEKQKHAAALFLEEAKLNFAQVLHGYTVKSDLIQHFIHMLDRFSIMCAFCFAYSGWYDFKHNIMACPKLKTAVPGTNEKDYAIFKQSIKYPSRTAHRPHICYMCHIPYLSSALHPPIQNNHHHCLDKYKDIILPISYAIYHLSELKLAAENHFNTMWKDLQEFGQWLVQADKGSDITYANTLFLWYTDYVNEHPTADG